MKVETTKAFGRPIADPNPPLNIVLTFNDREIGTSARKLLNKLFFRCADDLDVHYDEWSFDELDHPHCRAEALALAQGCYIFVVAANAISESFVDFCAEWLNSQGTSDRALILIQCQATCQASTEFASLRRLANDAGVICFSTLLPDPRNSARRTFCPNLLMACAARETSPIND